MERNQGCWKRGLHKKRSLPGIQAPHQGGGEREGCFLVLSCVAATAQDGTEIEIFAPRESQPIEDNLLCAYCVLASAGCYAYLV